MGDVIEADFRAGGTYYPGTIAKVHGNGKLDVAFDDGDFERRVPPALVRRHVRTLAIGQPIFVQWEGWWKATVQSRYRPKRKDGNKKKRRKKGGKVAEMWQQGGRKVE